MFNISLVTQILWSYLVGLLIFHEREKRVLYFVGFVFIIIGVVVFNLYDKKKVEIRSKSDIESNKDIHKSALSKVDILENENNKD